MQSMHMVRGKETHGLTGGDLQDLGRETNGALDMKLLVLSPVDEIARDCESNVSSLSRIDRRARN
jgi:hypothetical protein